MTPLYNISGDYVNLFNRFDEISDMQLELNDNGEYIDESGQAWEPDIYKNALLQAWFDTLEGIEEEFNIKAENIALFIKQLRTESEAVKTEEKILKERREQKERKLERLKLYLQSNMDACKLTKIDAPKVKISIRNNAESVIINDEMAFISWAQENNDELLKYSLPEIRKTEVKKLLQGGKSIPDARLERSRSLIIR